mmetsp:Transcript_8549/g.11545  ORF Transcript_8549/g.11545 Transcript_8549/m.11545 type:complete len:185 (+) Transcript_8549:128-682(+)|eukprot:CAMPEP_0201486074 /NCGR_PEP_ID=MMETSP0151_2-20130828/10138_1 /ASSEMBLY_ACC=CAM_ASM_000257 /TAXON_ID=200890 /ORGANISM="Paramoeba atlantica, Strain 621/1 / CCAP 1560/9" /LENGTH=184 /DNA_ID=CAMNT_0047870499 /DNA_START=130 /DNA_END=684 /DNA_ORIENTATION=+
MKIIVLGRREVGKSSLVLRFINKNFSSLYDPTIEELYQKLVPFESEKCLMRIVDSSGSEEYRAMRSQYAVDGEGFLCVYAVNSLESFEEIDEIRELLLRFRHEKKVPMVLCGNKCDLKDRKISTEEGFEKAQKFDCPFFETSAKGKINVDDAFVQLGREILTAAMLNEQKKKKKSRIRETCTIL